ncbi:MAG: COX15/CtaA family protein [Phycisphaerales bacterium]|nr:COX15/CtaA family protein [Phycisphaerales bacterium]
MNEMAAKPIVLAAWIATLIMGLRWVNPSQRLLAGLGAGMLSAVLGLLILGSKLAAAPDASGVSAGVRPGAALIAAGFLGLGLALGAVCGLIASKLPKPRVEAGNADWLSRFAWVTVAALAPLLFVGGLVTSTNSGMAVPDWPNSFGSNMFLYPLGPWLQPNVFFEHSHRLFGVLVGLSVLTLTILTLCWGPIGFAKKLAVACLVLVTVQAIFGGIRVQKGSAIDLEDAKAGRWIAFAHGVLAQLTMLAVVMLAVRLTAAFRTFDLKAFTLDLAMSKRARIFATGLMHATILQLIFGAMYRHTRSPHPLWAHVGFSIVVVIFAVAAGFILTSAQAKATSVGRVLGRIGLGLLVVVVVQFTLGWVTFGLGGLEARAGNIPQALLRTTHQANGALLLALATAAFVWGRAIGKARSAPLA